MFHSVQRRFARSYTHISSPARQPMSWSFTALVVALLLARPCCALPTIDEYFSESLLMMSDGDKSNDSVAFYRMGWCHWAKGPENIQEASNDFTAAAYDEKGCAHFFYLHYRCEFERSKNPTTDTDLQTLYEMLIDQDIRYYVHAGSEHYFEVDYLVLLLEDKRYAKEALTELKRLKGEHFVSLLGYLKYPYYCGTPVETYLLEAIQGRESEIAPAAKELVKKIETVDVPRITRYQNRLLLSEVDVFTKPEIDFLPGGQRRANSIRGAQIEGVAKRTIPAFRYLESRTELLNGIIRRAESAPSKP